jgi:hypothetical protein
MTNISALEKNLADIEARRPGVHAFAAAAASKLAAARAKHDSIVAAISAGKPPADTSSPLPDAERHAALAQQAVQHIEGERARAVADLVKAQRDAEISARQADLAAAADIAETIDALLDDVNEKFEKWVAATKAVGVKYNSSALTGEPFEAFRDHSGALVASRLHIDILPALRSDRMVTNHGPIASRVVRS